MVAEDDSLRNRLSTIREGRNSEYKKRKIKEKIKSLSG